MSEATTIEKLEERLKCAICLESYTDPKLLQCFHVYCRDCLVRLVIRDQQGQLVLTCPTCRQVTAIPANGVTGLQSAFQVKELLEVLEEHKKHKDTTNQEPEVAKSDMTKSVSSKKVTPYCLVHDNKELELYCETCEELICFHCSLPGQKHHSHKYDLISVCYEKYKVEMTPSLQPVEKQLITINRALADLDKSCGEISDQRAAIEADVHHSAQRLHEIIDVKKTELIRQLHQVTQEKLKILTTQRDKLETIQVQLKSCLEFVRESLKTSSQREVLKMKTTIFRQVKDLTPSFQPDVLKPNTKADVSFITSADLTARCQDYGRIGVPGRPDPSQCHATGKGLEVAVVREKSIAVIEVSDFQGGSCEKQISLQCELISELATSMVRGDVRRRGESQYEISYLPTIKGRHQLLIKIEDQHIRGSPFPVAVKSSLEKFGPPILTINGVNSPASLLVTDQSEIIVSESNGHCISVFSLSGKKLRSFGSYGSAEGQFNDPRGVAMDGEGNVLVVDRNNNRIQKFTANGQFLTAVGTHGDEPLQFDVPVGIAWNTCNNKVYVTEYLNHRIQVLNSDLTFSNSIGRGGSSKGEFNGPSGVSCDTSGLVYVADSRNHRIQVFTADGKFVRMFGRHGDGRGELNWPCNTATDTNGVVYVSDRFNHRISVFTPSGQFVMSFGSKGKFNFPRGLAVDESGVVYVCDNDNDRIQLF